MRRLSRMARSVVRTAMLRSSWNHIGKWLIRAAQRFSNATQRNTMQHTAAFHASPCRCQKYRQLASLVQKGDPEKSPRSAQFCTIRLLFAMPANRLGNLPAGSLLVTQCDTCNALHFTRAPAGAKNIGNWLLPKIRTAPFGEKPYPCPSVCHLWFHLGVVDRRESVCIGGSFVPPRP
jgi:hypothetical protein